MKTNDKPEIKLFLLDKTDHRMYLSKIPVTEDYYWTSSPNSPYYTMPMVVWPRNEVYGENKSHKVLDKEDSDAKWACGVRPAMMIDRQLLEAQELRDGSRFWLGLNCWVVLDSETGLCISKDIICKRIMDSDDNIICWINSELRTWMNTELLDRLFDEGERKLIKPIGEDQFCNVVRS